MKLTDSFHEFAKRTSKIMGSPWAFVLAVLFIVVWAFTGPMFHFSNTWQLVINTSTTIITFLMVFLLQNTQNRDSEAEQIKIDELLRAVKGARTSLINVENLTDEELKVLEEEFQALVGAEKTKRAENRPKRNHNGGHGTGNGK